MASTGMLIDGIFASEVVDSSGEVLDIDGADISDFEEGRGVANYEHKQPDDEDKEGKKPNNGEEVVGRIVFAKKVRTAADADTEREKHFWEKVRHPFIYGIVRLHDGAGHSGAKALAAQIRDAHANKEPILVRYSIEGSTLERDGNRLKTSMLRRVALTLKPCNRTADSGLLADPNAPDGWEKEPYKKDPLEGLGKNEHPMFRRLGGQFAHVLDEVDENELRKTVFKNFVIRKALTAGSTDAAPSSLTGGAALQREDIIKLRAKAMKSLKGFLDKNFDFDHKQAFDAIKAEVPEASDEFVHHFADIADDYKLKLRKDIDHGLEDDLPKLNPDIGGGIAGHAPRVDIASEPKGKMPPKKKGGTEMKAGGKMYVGKPGGSTRVSLQQHFPDDEHYHAILKPDLALADGTISDDKYQELVRTVHEPWHRAMSNWLPLNRALSEGKVPKGIIAKSVIFAAMSPNTPVFLQERYFGHYMDMLREGKVDPFKPISDEAVDEFTARSASGNHPEWNRGYYEQEFARHEAQRKLASKKPEGDDAMGGEEERDVGDLPQILGLRNAHKLMPYLEHLIAKHKDDGQQIAGELMDMKAEHNRFKLATDIDRRQKRNIEREAPDHERILGYGPKLTRYLLGMIGAGNFIVPDRHMIRSTFDLSMEPSERVPGKVESPPLLDKPQTSVFTKAQNEPLLRAVDHNFFMNHPAVKHVLETFPKHFAGRERQAVFPAFWLHWLAIGHHDQMRGRPFVGFNDGTDHRVFWDSVHDEMVKHGLHPHPMNGGPKPLDTSFDFGDETRKSVDPWPRHPNHAQQPVWLKAAGVLSALRQRWGENAALLAFFSHVVPHIQAAETPVPPVVGRSHAAYNPALVKMQGLLVDLRKAVAQHEGDHEALDEVAPHLLSVYRFIPGPDRRIRRHLAGRFMTAGNQLHVLEDYHGHLKSTLSEGPLDGERQEQIKNLISHPKYEVVPLSDVRSGKRPELVEAPAPEPKPQSSWDLSRKGQTSPDHLQFVGGKATLNGHPLNDEQLHAVRRQIAEGHASIRYRKLEKMEAFLTDLMKAGEDPTKIHEALGRLDELVKQGVLEPHHAEALRNHAMKDPMTGNVMGNKFAYTDFKNRSADKGGVHVMLDANDFKRVNDTWGHETGDNAIKAMGTALRSAMDEVAPGEGKLFRNGGDEFAAHLPTHEHASAFARAVRNKLEAIPPIQGTHKLSMGFGFGSNPEQADKALYEAKKAKYDPAGMVGNDSRKWVSKFAPGTTPSLAHSLVPGFEGAVPLHHDQLSVTPPKMPEVEPPKPAAAAPAPAVPAAPKPQV